MRTLAWQIVAGVAAVSLTVACGDGASPNRPPDADAGSDRTVAVGTPATLDASGSSDPDGDGLDYAWTLEDVPSGSSADLSRTDGATTELTPDQTGRYTVSLSVSDGAASDSAEVTLSAAEPAPAPTFSQDDEVTPAVEEIDAAGGKGARPVARITDGKGNAADFVANELIVMTDDASALQRFVDRWNGTVVRTIGFSDEDPSLSSAQLVRIDPSSADPTELGEDLRQLDPDSTGTHRVSSEAGLGTLAAGAAEATGGATITANWLLPNDDIVSGETGEDPSISDGSLSDPSDAFTWPYMNRGSP